jgi:hypothetical protein
MSEKNRGFYGVEEVADLLRTTPNAIYVAVAEGRDGETIPPSIKLGGRRLFLKKIVHRWFDDLENQIAA